jgi:hypothetical protein
MVNNFADFYGNILALQHNRQPSVDMEGSLASGTRNSQGNCNHGSTVLFAAGRGDSN